MAKITRIEAMTVNPVPAVKHTDAVQSFVYRETPILRITDGVMGTRYSYTIGSGGPAITSLLKHKLAPALIGQIWRGSHVHDSKLR